MIVYKLLIWKITCSPTFMIESKWDNKLPKWYCDVKCILPNCYKLFSYFRERIKILGFLMEFNTYTTAILWFFWKLNLFQTMTKNSTKYLIINPQILLNNYTYCVIVNDILWWRWWRICISRKHTFEWIFEAIYAII